MIENFVYECYNLSKQINKFELTKSQEDGELNNLEIDGECGYDRKRKNECSEAL